MARGWRDDFLLVTATTQARAFIACEVSQAFLTRVRQVIISEVAPYCQRPLLAWHTLGAGEERRFPRRLVAAPRIANETAARLGWDWRWMLLADDDCVVTASRDLWHALQALDHSAPWYLGALDSLWQPAPHVTILQPEDGVRLPGGRTVNADTIFPACTLPVETGAQPATGTPGGTCSPQIAGDPRQGCVRGPALAACALDLLAVPRSNASAAAHVPFGYALPLTIVYGNGFVMSRGMLRVGGLRDAAVDGRPGAVRASSAPSGTTPPARATASPFCTLAMHVRRMSSEEAAARSYTHACCRSPLSPAVDMSRGAGTSAPGGASAARSTSANSSGKPAYMKGASSVGWRR